MLELALHLPLVNSGDSSMVDRATHTLAARHVERVALRATHAAASAIEDDDGQCAQLTSS